MMYLQKCLTKFRVMWSKLALHVRITVLMIVVLTVSLTIASTSSYALLSNMLSHRIGLRVFDMIGENEVASKLNSDGKIVMRAPSFGNGDTLPLDRFEAFANLGGDNGKFMGKISREVDNSLISFFVGVTLLIVLLSGAIIYIVTRRTLNRVKYEQDRLKRFVADASHDLRTPLAVISGYAELLQINGDVNLNTASEKAVAKIHDNAKRMTSLVDDMLVLARLDRANNSSSKVDGEDSSQIDDTVKQIHTTPYSAKEFVESVSDEFKKAYPDTKIVTVLDESAVIEINQDNLRRILDNLFTNAQKYAGRDASITVKTYKNTKGFHLIISDNGVGVSKDKLETIFERFTKYDESRSTHGNGLGLAIVKELVQSMGGIVWASPTDKTTGLGLTVHVNI